MPFTDFGSLTLISLFLGIISARTIYQTIRNRKTLFDDRFTTSDRQHMSMAAYFILIPISVFFHEVGHAVAVWYYGGEVVTFGYFLFFGFVEHRGFYSADDVFWIALSGNLVSIGMGLSALAWAFLRPMRAPLNYLLIMFGILSLLISLVFYPAMDLLSDLHGDWSQIYTWDTTELSIGAGVLHGALLLGLVAGWRSDRVRTRYAELTGLRPEEVRRVGRRDLERELLEASAGAAGKFDGLARAEAGGSSRDAVSVQIDWSSGGYHRSVVVVGVLTGQPRVEMLGVVRALDGSNGVAERRVARVRGLPEPAKLEPQVLKALKVVDTWKVARDRQPEK